MPNFMKMRFILSIAYLVAFMGSFGYFVVAEEIPEFLYIPMPRPRVYSMEIKEFHDCVSCHKDKGARDDFVACLEGLPPQIRKNNQACCKRTFDNNFCKSASLGQINFKTICKNPSKALEVEQCAWKKVVNRDTPEVKKFKECKRAILKKYCTTSSGY